MIRKALKIALASGLVSALLVPVSDYIYRELTVTDPAVSQYNAFSLLAGIAYIPFTFIFCFLAALALLKMNVRPKPILAIVTLIATAGVGTFFFFHTLFV